MLRLALIVSLLGLAVAEARPRVAVLTDGSREQRCSLVRLLLYLDGLTLEVLLHQGDGAWIDEKLGFYAQCQLRLQENASSFPEAAELRAAVRQATIPTIVEQLLKPSKERLHFLAWSGADEVFDALSQIENAHADKKALVANRTSVHFMGELDETALATLNRWPEMEVLITGKQQGAVLGEDWRHHVEGAYADVLKGQWMATNILQSHGPLCASYEAHGTDAKSPYAAGDCFGESPSLTFLRLVPNGLGSHLSPAYGGWGGRYERLPGFANVWQNVHEEASPGKSVWRWLTHMQGDWSARADWCVRGTKQANHPPVAAVNGNVGTSVLRAKAKAGQKLALDASASEDPDKQRIGKAWWHYTEASTYTDGVEMDGLLKEKIEFTVPFDTEPQTHHVMVTVRDGGTPSLFAYRRLLIEAEPGQDSTPPTSAPVLSGKALDARSISLSWTPASDAESGIRRYELYRDDVLVKKDFTELKYLDEDLPEATAFRYHVVALNGALLPSAPSNKFELETVADTIEPELTTVVVASGALTLTFSEALEKRSAEEPANYQLSSGAMVSAASLGDDGLTVTLTTSPLPLGKTPCYLIVSGVQDLAVTPNGVASGTSYGFLYEDSQ